MGRVGAFGVFLEGELLDRIGLGTVRVAAEEPRHGKAQVARILAFPKRAPGGIFRGLEDLGQVTRIGQLVPAVHLKQGRIGAGQEGRVGCRCDLRHLAQKLDVLGAVIEMIVAHEAGIRLAAELAKFLFVDLLENR